MQLRVVFFALLIFLTFSQVNIAQNIEKTEAFDAVKFFDEHKRWNNGFTESWFYFSDIPEEEIRKVIIQWEEIGKDLKDSKTGWAATYQNGGDTHGDYFRWSEKNGFIWLKVNKCRGGPMQIIRGKVFVSEFQIRLIPEQTFGEMHSHKVHRSQQTELLFVKWGGVPFLVNKESIEDFADYTAGLGEFNGYFHFLGSPFFSKLGSDFDEKAVETVIFPKGFEKFVKKPIKAEIISIGKSFRRIDESNDDWEVLVIPVRLNVGSLNGVSRDMQFFYVIGEQNLIENITIKKVSAKFSTAEITRSVRKKNCVSTEYNDCENPEYIKLKVGLRVSTTGY